MIKMCMQCAQAKNMKKDEFICKDCDKENRRIERLKKLGKFKCVDCGTTKDVKYGVRGHQCLKCSSECMPEFEGN